jgi:flagellar export protein FliJ
MVFKFRLDKVLMMRQEAVDKARIVVVEAVIALTKAQKALDDNIREIKQRNEDLIKNNYDMAQDHLRVIKAMHIQQKKLKDNVKSAEFRLEKAKKDLLDAQMKLEALQKLKEKQAEEYYIEENLLEQKETDERVSLKFATDMLQNAQEFEEN